MIAVTTEPSHEEDIILQLQLACHRLLQGRKRSQFAECADLENIPDLDHDCEQVLHHHSASPRGANELIGPNLVSPWHSIQISTSWSLKSARFNLSSTNVRYTSVFSIPLSFEGVAVVREPNPSLVGHQLSCYHQLSCSHIQCLISLHFQGGLSLHRELNRRSSGQRRRDYLSVFRRIVK